MAIRAYILIETGVGQLTRVRDRLSSLPGVEDVDRVTGPYDVIAVVEAADLNEVGRLVTERIHTINGVERTLTCLVLGRG